MTAIAYRDGVLAADTLVTRGDLRLSEPVCKVRAVETDEGYELITGSGSMSIVQAFMKWAEEGCEGPAPPIPVDDDTAILLFRPNRLTALFTEKGVSDSNDPFMTTGEFRFLAGCMVMGASPVRAVQLACRYSTGCGYPIDVFTHEDGHADRLHSDGEVFAWEREYARLHPKNARAWRF